ncbi:Uncharacterized protein TPS_01787 [Trichinella pseudospiralis]
MKETWPKEAPIDSRLIKSLCAQPGRIVHREGIICRATDNQSWTSYIGVAETLANVRKGSIRLATPSNEWLWTSLDHLEEMRNTFSVPGFAAGGAVVLKDDNECSLSWPKRGETTARRNKIFYCIVVVWMSLNKRERGQKVNPDCDDHRLSLKTQSELPASGGVALQ